MHVAVNMEDARRCHNVVLMLGHCHQWRHRFGVSWGVPRLRLLPVMIDCYTLPHFPNKKLCEFRSYHYLIYIIIFSIE